MNNNIYVQYGCGRSVSFQWRNFDASPTLRLERLPLIGALYKRDSARFPDIVEYGDIVKGLPVQLNSCVGVYCSHVLEHLSLADFRTALRNTFRILRPDGIFRLVLPDLEYLIGRYIGNTSSEAAIQFMRETHLGKERRPKGLRSIFIAALGNSSHLWMWDYKSMSNELRDAGFVGIRRASYGDSTDPHFSVIEDLSRWTNCLGVECRRPV